MRLRTLHIAGTFHILGIVDGRMRYPEIEASIRRSRAGDTTSKLPGRKRRTEASAGTLLNDSMVEFFGTGHGQLRKALKFRRQRVFPENGCHVQFDAEIGISSGAVTVGGPRADEPLQIFGGRQIQRRLIGEDHE